MIRRIVLPTDVDADLFATPCGALVIPTNCRGVMGAGLALKATKRHPRASELYRKTSRGVTQPGDVMAVQLTDEDPRWVLFAATKDHWKHPSQIGWVRACCRTVVARCRELDIVSVAVPALGAGLGGVPWPLVLEAFHDIFRGGAPGIMVDVYAPQEAPRD